MVVRINQHQRPTTTHLKFNSKLGLICAQVWVPTRDVKLWGVIFYCGWRWKIEQFHREAKQLTGLEKCQCRKARIQRNHIACAFLVWVRMAEVARKIGKTLYQLKHGLLDDYLCQQLKNPSIKMKLA